MKRTIKLKKQPKPKKLSLPKLKAKAQSLFNSYIRQRDMLPSGKWICISCKKEVDKCNASHYVPVKLSSALRYDERNVNCSCIRCNLLEGNTIPYRRNLIKKIGIDELNLIEDIAINNPNKVWNESELLDIIEKYKNLTKI